MSQTNLDITARSISIGQRGSRIRTERSGGAWIVVVISVFYAHARSPGQILQKIMLNTDVSVVRAIVAVAAHKTRRNRFIAGVNNLTILITNKSGCRRHNMPLKIKRNEIFIPVQFTSEA